MEKSENIYLRCEFCSFKFDVNNGVKEIKLNNPPGGVSFIDKEENIIKTPPNFPRRKMYKCPKCGRGVASKQLTTPPKVFSTKKIN